MLTDRGVRRLGSGVILGIVVFAGVAYMMPRTVAPGSTESEHLVRPVSEMDHILGNPDAPLKIYVYTDLECQYCKSYHLYTMPTLRKEYGDLAFVFRHFPQPSRPQAYPEAIAAECAATIGGNEAFWQYVDRIYATTPSNNGLDLGMLDVVAKDLGLDMDAFTSCRSDGVAERRVQFDMLDGAGANIRITPSSVIVYKGESVLVSGDFPNRLRAAINAMRTP